MTAAYEDITSLSKEFWTPEVGEELAYQREEGNLNDVYAVAVKIDMTNK